MSATLRGTLSAGGGVGGAATCLTAAGSGPGVSGTSQVSAATASTLPAPTRFDGERAAPRAVAVMRCIT
jgi:hypothetical protein